MKKLSKLLLVVMVVMVFSMMITSCLPIPEPPASTTTTTTTTTKKDDPLPPPPADPVIESISVSGQKTEFFTDDEFTVGDMSVTLKYDDGSTKVAAEDEYTVDSSAYIKDTAGTYIIKVLLNNSELETEYSVTVSERQYSVSIPSNVRIISGVENNKTTLGDTITFDVSVNTGKHLVSVKVNDTVIDAIEGVYSFKSADYLTDIDSEIVITVEEAEHNYTTVVTSPTCSENGYTTYTCTCGQTFTGDKTEASLLGDLSKWISIDPPMVFERTEDGTKITQSRNDTWSFQKRDVVISESDKYIVIDFDSISAGATLQIQFEGTNDIYKKNLVPNKRNIFSLEELGVTSTGKYVLTLYILGNEGTSAIIRELAFLETPEATIHNYGDAVITESSCFTPKLSITTCLDCGTTHTEIIEEARFLYANTGVWTISQMTLSLENGIAKLTMNEGQTWGSSYRKINLKTTDYLRFTANGRFKVEIMAPGADVGTLIIPMQEMNGTPIVIPLDSVVNTDGEYTILIYPEGAAGSTHSISECFILSSADEQVHNYGEASVIAGTCHSPELSVKTCANCGAQSSEVIDEAEFLYANANAWIFSQMTMKYENGVAVFTMNEGQTWGSSYRKVDLKTTDYLRFTANGRFKVEIQGPNDSVGTLIIPMQEMNGTPITIALDSVVKEDGEYLILIYPEGEVASTHTIIECFILSSADDEVHTFDEWTESNGTKSHTCTECGFVETTATE